MVALAHEVHPGVKISMITNGSMFTDRNIDSLISGGVEMVMVSIESAKPETFQQIRGGDLNKVIEGIRRLMEARHRLGNSRPAVGFAVTVLRQTITDLPDILRLYDELKLDAGVTVQNLQDMSAYVAHYDQAMKEQIPRADDIARLQQSMDMAPDAWAILRRPVTVAGFYNSLFANWQPSSLTCPWLSRGLYVTADGNALACCFMKDTPRDSLGLVNDDIASILVKREQIQSQLTGPNVPAGCRNCFIAKAIAQRVNGRSHQECINQSVDR